MREKIKVTSSTGWLLPMYKMSIKEWQRVGMVNAFLHDETIDRAQDTPHMRILCEASEEYCMLLEDVMMMLDEYVLDMYGINSKFVVLVLRIPEEYMDDYTLIIQGSYSKLSNDYRDLVSEKVLTMNEASYKSNGKRAQVMIMNKDPQVKRLAASIIQDMDNVQEGEIWERPNIQIETITQTIIDKLIENGDQ